MSDASDDDPGPLGFRVLPRWMDGWVALVAAPLFAILGAVALIAAVVLAVLVARGRFSIDWLPGIVGISGFGVICLVLYGGAHRRIVISDAPSGAPPDRLFYVSLLARRGWLRRFVEPTTNAFLVIGDDGIRLRYRRPVSSDLFILGFLVLGHSHHLKHVGVTFPLYLQWIGLAAWSACGLASLLRRSDHRFPWTGVISVSAGAIRFHLRVADEEWPDSRRGRVLRYQETTRRGRGNGAWRGLGGASGGARGRRLSQVDSGKGVARGVGEFAWDLESAS